MPWCFDFPMPKNADGRCYYCNDTGFHTLWTSNMHSPVSTSFCSCPVGDKLRDEERNSVPPGEAGLSERGRYDEVASSPSGREADPVLPNQ